MCMITLDATTGYHSQLFVPRPRTDIKSLKWQSQLKLYFRKPYQSWVDRDGHCAARGPRLELAIECILPYDYEYLATSPLGGDALDRPYLRDSNAGAARRWAGAR